MKQCFLHIRWVVFLWISFVGLFVSAQDSTKIYVDQLRALDSVDLRLADKAIRYEERKASPADSVLGALYHYRAIASTNKRPQQCLESYAKALQHYRAIDDVKKVEEVMSNMRPSMLSLRLNVNFYANSEFRLGHEKDTLLSYFNLDSLLRWNEDTAYILIDGGYSQGVFPLAEGGVLTQSDGTERENTPIGKVFVDQILANSSVLKFYYYPGLKPQGLLKGDLVAIQTEVRKTKTANVIEELVGKNVLFTTLGGVDYYSTYEARSQFSDQLTEEIKLSMLHEINYSGAWLVVESGADTFYVEGGRFNGQTQGEALLNSTLLDLELFLAYVHEYPFTYMGQDQDIVRSYLSYLIYPTPVHYLTDLEPMIKEEILALPYDEDSVRSKKDEFVYYIKKIHGDGGELFNSLFTETKKEDVRNEFAQKMIWLADSSLTDTIQANILLWQAYTLIEEESFDQAIINLDKVVELGFKPSAYFGLGYCYFEMEDYHRSIEFADSAMAQDNEYFKSLASVNKGAALFRLGNWKKAKPYFTQAYEEDSFSAVRNLNMGIALMFDGNRDSAKHYFEKCLSLTATKTEFEGFLEAFDFNMEKGWMESLNQEHKSFMLERWEEKYEMEVMSDEYWEKALGASNNDEHLLAQGFLDTAIYAELHNEEVNYSDIRVYYRQKGYSYYMLQMYDSSLINYKRVVDINKEHLQNMEWMVLDYDNVGNLYSWLNDDVNEQIYDQLEYVTALRLRLDTLRPNVHLLTINTSTDDMPFQYGEQDHKALADLLMSEGNKAIKEVYVTHLKNPNVDQIQKQFLKLAESLSTDDILILHLAGPSYHYKGSNGLKLQSDSMALNKLFNSLGYLKTFQTICIADIPNVNFVQEYVSFRNSQGVLSNETDNVLVLAPAAIRLENSKQMGSEFIRAVLQNNKESNNVNTEDLVSSLRKNYSLNEPHLMFNSFSSGQTVQLVSIADSSSAEEEPLVEPSRGTRVTQLKDHSETNMSTASDQTPKDYALIFACNDYDDWSPLSNPIRDAEALKKLLEEYYGFKVELVLNPTKDMVMEKIVEYKGKTFGPKDQLLIYFAGHGHYEDGNAYFVCKNSVIGEEQRKKLYPTYVHYSILYSEIGYMQSCKNVMLVMDVCFGGAFFDKAETGNVYNAGDSEDLDQLMDNKRQIPTRLFLTSGSREYVPDGAPGTNSPFTSRFLQALTERKGPGSVPKDMVTLTDIVSYMHGLPTKIKYGSFASHHQNGDFIFHYQPQSSLPVLQSSE